MPNQACAPQNTATAPLSWRRYGTGYFAPTGRLFFLSPDNSPPPADHPQQYVPTSRPGHRAPHFWVSDTQALYDQFGAGFNLVRTDSQLPVERLVREAHHRGIPFKIVDTTSPHAQSVYELPLTLVRPDLMVAWRGEAEPDNVSALWDVVTGWTP